MMNMCGVLTVRGDDGDHGGLEGVLVLVGGGAGRLVRHHPPHTLRLQLHHITETVHPQIRGDQASIVGSRVVRGPMRG
jgi:hypothetical protein